MYIIGRYFLKTFAKPINSQKIRDLEILASKDPRVRRIIERYGSFNSGKISSEIYGNVVRDYRAMRADDLYKNSLSLRTVNGKINKKDKKFVKEVELLGNNKYAASRSSGSLAGERSKLVYTKFGLKHK